MCAVVELKQLFGLLLLLNICRTLVAVKLQIETKAGQTFDAVCPAKHYVSGVKLTRETLKNGDVDFRFTVDCDSFYKNVADDKGDESCQVLLPIPLLNYQIQIDSLEQNCDCNEYLVGIRSEHFGEQWAGKVQGKERRIQLVCCRANNRRIDRCGYTGQDSLFSPWKESEVGTARLLDKPRPGAIQSLMFTNNYLNARVCSWTNIPIVKIIKDFDIDYGCYEDWTCIRNTGGSRCWTDSTEPFGWSETLSYNARGASGNMAMFVDSANYGRQIQICKTGEQVISVEKTKLSKGSNNRPDQDYNLSVKCAPLGNIYPCYCYWLDRCPSTTINKGFLGLAGVWYVAGLRSWWNSSSKQRKVESLCCKTNGLEVANCEDSAKMPDSMTTFNLKGANLKIPAIKGNRSEVISVIQDIQTFGVFSSLVLQFRVCNAYKTYEWCEDDDGDGCYDCRRKTSKSVIQRSLPAPRPPPVGAASGVRGTGSSGSSSVWQSSSYTHIGSSGWGPIWFIRPLTPVVVGRTSPIFIGGPSCPVVTAPPAHAPAPPGKFNGQKGHGGHTHDWNDDYHNGNGGSNGQGNNGGNNGHGGNGAGGSGNNNGHGGTGSHDHNGNNGKDGHDGISGNDGHGNNGHSGSSSNRGNDHSDSNNNDHSNSGSNNNDHSNSGSNNNDRSSGSSRGHSGSNNNDNSGESSTGHSSSSHSSSSNSNSNSHSNSNSNSNSHSNSNSNSHSSSNSNSHSNSNSNSNSHSNSNSNSHSSSNSNSNSNSHSRSNSNRNGGSSSSKNQHEDSWHDKDDHSDHSSSGGKRGSESNSNIRRDVSSKNTGNSAEESGNHRSHSSSNSKSSSSSSKSSSSGGRSVSSNSRTGSSSSSSDHVRHVVAPHHPPASESNSGGRVITDHSGGAGRDSSFSSGGSQTSVVHNNVVQQSSVGGINTGNGVSINRSPFNMGTIMTAASIGGMIAGALGGRSINFGGFHGGGGGPPIGGTNLGGNMGGGHMGGGHMGGGHMGGGHMGGWHMGGGHHG